MQENMQDVDMLALPDMLGRPFDRGCIKKRLDAWLQLGYPQLRRKPCLGND